MKPPFILWFIPRCNPTKEERLKSFSMVANVSFRNALVVGPNDCLEQCDGVTGEVPEVYQAKPTAEEAIAAYESALSDAIEQANEPLPPEPKKTKAESKPAVWKPNA